MQPLDVTVYANTKIVGQHGHYKAILIVFNFIIYKLYIFFRRHRDFNSGQ